jgi:serine/threonine protein phosphatase PrpC
MDEEPTPSNDAGRRSMLSPVLSVEQFQPLSALVKVEFGAHSCAGAGRDTNEDHFLILRLGRHQEVMASTLPEADLPERFDEHGYAIVVADGTGELGSGALASRVAISALAHVAIHSGKWNLRVNARTAEDIANQAELFYQRAAHAVERRGMSNPLLAGMKTTLTITFSAGDELFYAHVGDSHAYLFRTGELTRLTCSPSRDDARADRLLVAVTDLSHMLNDALGGGRGTPAVDVERVHLLDNDTILLCTDGLTAVLDEDIIAERLAHPRTLNDLCKDLVDLAVSKGGGDATAVLAKYRIPSLREPSA